MYVNIPKAWMLWKPGTFSVGSKNYWFPSPFHVAHRFTLKKTRLSSGRDVHLQAVKVETVGKHRHDVMDVIEISTSYTPKS